VSTLSSVGRGLAVGLVTATALVASPIQALAQNLAFESLHEFTNLPGLPTGGLVKAPDGTFYGTALMDPPTQPGGVFSLRPRDDGSYEYRLLHAFANASQSLESGRYPYAGLVLASDGHLYGTTSSGGTHDAGTLFKITVDGVLTSLHSFDGVRGRAPLGRLVQGADGYLYGTTVAGGYFNLGTIFRISTTGAHTVVHHFWWFTGASPVAGLIQASDGNFYGTTFDGGFVILGPGQYTWGGTIFRMTPTGFVTPIHYFNGQVHGTRPIGALTQASDGHLYGATSQSGSETDGALYRITTGGLFTQLHEFPKFGGRPMAELRQASDGYLYGEVTGFTGGYSENQPNGALFRMSLGGTVEILHTFNIVDGKLPFGGVTEGSDGALYGGTVWGGAERHGSIYRFSAGGMSTVHSFRGGVVRPEGLIRSRDGHFYGVDRSSGPALTGTIFKLAPDGTYTPLHTLLKAEGTTPSPLLHAADGHFYGTTRLGGAHGSGGVFRITSQGDFAIVASFGENDGISGLPLVQAPDGTFYGTMEYGLNGKGSIFRMTPDGVVSTVYAISENFMSGIKAIILGTDGHLYGVTQHGGPDQRGTVFKVTTAGEFTTLHTFSGGTDGSEPVSRLAQGADGFLYGTTTTGGAGGLGTVFRISTSGALTTLHAFTGADGRWPLGPLHAASDGMIYGTSRNAGEGLPMGAVFRITPATGAVTIVHFLPADGSEGDPELSGVVEGGDGRLYGLTWVAPSPSGGGIFYRLVPQ
jgi:uncharacterized repeat protein (TIGR03803 family)